MTELLVLMACAAGSGCSQTTEAYYEANPAIRQATKYHGRRLKRMAGPAAVVVSPLVILATKGRASINLGHNLSLEFSTKDSSSVILYNYSF